jgi:hypothetical protein
VLGRQSGFLVFGQRRRNSVTEYIGLSSQPAHPPVGGKANQAFTTDIGFLSFLGKKGCFEFTLSISECGGINAIAYSFCLIQ